MTAGVSVARAVGAIGPGRAALPALDSIDSPGGPAAALQRREKDPRRISAGKKAAATRKRREAERLAAIPLQQSDTPNVPLVRYAGSDEEKPVNADDLLGEFGRESALGRHGKPLKMDEKNINRRREEAHRANR